MTERRDLLSSIVSTIQDYRSGEVEQPTPEHVDRWIRQFDTDVQIPMLRELDYVFKRTYVSRDKAQQLFADTAEHFPLEFWQKANILNIQRNGRSQAEIRQLFSQILRERYGPDINCQSSEEGAFVYLDDAIFTGTRVIEDLSYWTQNRAPAKLSLHIIVLALHRGGTYWIEQNEARWKSGKEIDYQIWRFDEFDFENRRYHRNQSDVLWPTAEVYSTEDFEPRSPVPSSSRVFASEQGRQLLEREFLNKGLMIQGYANNPAPRLKPLGFYRFNPGFGSMFVTYRNCPNNCPLALWYGEPDSYPASHPLGRWYPLFRRKPYNQ